jgi:hypothetical protein
LFQQQQDPDSDFIGKHEGRVQRVTRHLSDASQLQFRRERAVFKVARDDLLKLAAASAISEP